MEIRFSDGSIMESVNWRSVMDAAKHAGATAQITSTRYEHVRFTLPGADEAQHDAAIAYLFELDPDAVVRTARAVYEGREDFEAQRKARVK